MLAFVNWRAVNALFCRAMWLVAFTLAIVILVHAVGTDSAAHHAAHTYLR